MRTKFPQAQKSFSYLFLFMIFYFTLHPSEVKASFFTQSDTLEYIGVPEIETRQNTSFGVLVSGGSRVTTAMNYNEMQNNIVGIGVFDFGIIYEKKIYLGVTINNLAFAKLLSKFYDTTYHSQPLFSLEYYGLEVGYNIYQSENLKIHLNTSFASGVLGYKPQSNIKYKDSVIDNANYDSKNFLLVEPTAFLTYNLNNWVRVASGIGFRVPINTNYSFNGEVYNNTNLTGFSVFLKVQFGDLWI